MDFDYCWHLNDYYEDYLWLDSVEMGPDSVDWKYLVEDLMIVECLADYYESAFDY